MKKKVFAFVLTVAVVTSFAIMPAFAANLDKEMKSPKVSRDFEAFEATEEPFSKETKPEGFIDMIGGGQESGASGIIVDNGVGGTKSLRLYRKGGYHEPGNIRLTTEDFDYGDLKEVAIQFSFRMKQIGDYGFTAIISVPGSGLEDWGDDGKTNLFAVRTEKDTGITLNAHDNGGLVAAKTNLETDKDYVLTAVFTLGSNEYTVALNNEIVGTYHYHLTVPADGGISGLRLDDHGYAKGTTDAENLIDEIYFDNIMIGAVSNKTGGSDTPTDPTPTPSNPDKKPNTNTGDTMYLAVVVAMAAVLATVVAKKRTNI